MRNHHRTPDTARAEALFASPVPTGTPLTPSHLDAAVIAAIGRHGGLRQCAAIMAAEFGDYPETAARRMRWALRLASARRTEGTSDVEH